MPATPSLDDIITEIETWFAEHLRRPPIAHDVAVYNQAYAAAEHLKGRMVELFTGKPVASPVLGAEPEPAVTDAAGASKAKPSE